MKRVDVSLRNSHGPSWRCYVYLVTSRSNASPLKLWQGLSWFQIQGQLLQLSPRRLHRWSALRNSAVPCLWAQCVKCVWLSLHPFQKYFWLPSVWSVSGWSGAEWGQVDPLPGVMLRTPSHSAEWGCQLESVSSKEKFISRYHCQSQLFPPVVF